MEMPVRTRVSARMWMSFMFQFLMFRRAEIDDCGYWSRSTLPISASPVDGHRRRQARSHSPSGIAYISLCAGATASSGLLVTSQPLHRTQTDNTSHHQPDTEDYQSPLRTIEIDNRPDQLVKSGGRRVPPPLSNNSYDNRLCRTAPKTLSSMTTRTSNDIGTHPGMAATRSQTIIIQTTSASVPPPANSRLLSRSPHPQGGPD
ncbi:hypothetical protein PGTUg99_016683 [Puccinia graminis f. sp. tritici]|uniref:Uncharacterized protein n=2 Tax=Puccinia graminis f. sp. tritici TaxID=56615 RepID=A0A5B0LS65_PUCGR|nr:hypothetical protein PGTUg99_016683 [Puccinia graminis f. sp. tritici]